MLVLWVVQMKDPSTGAGATGVDVARYRAPDGTWRPTVELPPELHKPLAHAILEECCGIGIARRV